MQVPPPPPPPSPSASLFRTHFNPCYARGKTSLSRGKKHILCPQISTILLHEWVFEILLFRCFFLFFQQLHLALYSHNAGLVSTALKLMYRARYLALIVFGERTSRHGHIWCKNIIRSYENYSWICSCWPLSLAETVLRSWQKRQLN